MKSVRIATRGSDLALAQSEWFAGKLKARFEIESEMVVIKTTGDKIQDQSLSKVGGKGLFIKELEEALLGDRADVAVHSAKDLPSGVPTGLALVAFPQRADYRDALVSQEPGLRLQDLPRGARVGTGSARRSALLLAQRPDLEIVPMRGNVPTRLGKLKAEGLDAIILAAAGLDRLGLGERISERLDPEILLPAVAQGTLAIEMRAGSGSLADVVRELDDAGASLSAGAERSFLAALEGDCSVPLAALARDDGAGKLHVQGLVSSTDGSRVVRSDCVTEATPQAAEEAGRRLASEVLSNGGAEVLDSIRAHESH